MNKILQQDEIRQKVETLLARMSLDQKIGQMTQSERLSLAPENVRDHHLGSVLSGGGSAPGDNLPADWVAMNDAYWAASMTQDASHLPIPAIYGVDAIHGHNNVIGATLFPHNIGLGAANNAKLIEDIAAITAYVDSVACLNRRIHHHAMQGEQIPDDIWHAMYGNDAYRTVLGLSKKNLI